jgi:hypothetical protein
MLMSHCIICSFTKSLKFPEFWATSEDNVSLCPLNVEFWDVKTCVIFISLSSKFFQCYMASWLHKWFSWLMVFLSKKHCSSSSHFNMDAIWPAMFLFPSYNARIFQLKHLLNTSEICSVEKIYEKECLHSEYTNHQCRFGSSPSFKILWQQKLLFKIFYFFILLVFFITQWGCIGPLHTTLHQRESLDDIIHSPVSELIEQLSNSLL